MTATTAPRMMLPSFTFDLRTHPVFVEVFDDDRISEMSVQWSDFAPLPSAIDVELWIDEFVDEDDVEDLAKIVAGDDVPNVRQVELRRKYDPDEIRMAFIDAERHAYESAMTPNTERIERALRESIEACKGEEMYGILTDTYWCGVLAAYPWADVSTDEDAVVEAVLDKAKVKGTTFTLSYRSTPYNAALRRVAREDDGDPGFGGNTEMELGTISRYVCKAAVVLLQREIDSVIERGGVDADRNELKKMLAEACKVTCPHPGGFRTDDGRWECSRCGHLFASYEAWGEETGNQGAVAAVKAAIAADIAEMQGES